MESRRDQAHAYFFVLGRLSAAVTHGRPNALELPNKRFRLGTLLGVVLSVVVMAIFGIIGLLKPGGNTSWRAQGAVVLNEDSGAKYVYLDGKLHPVHNLASARLVAGSAGPPVAVSANSLRGAEVGLPIGIPGAPDELPVEPHKGAWTVCALPAVEGSGLKAALLLRADPTPPAGPEQAALVAAPDGVTYLLWQGRRHRVTAPVVLETLGYGAVVPTPVTLAWLNPIPSGPDVAVPDTPGAGQPGPQVDGKPTRVGQVFEIRNPATGTTQLYLVRADGKAPLSRTAAALLLAAPAARQAYSGWPTLIEAGPGALAEVPESSSGPDLVGTLPPSPPKAIVPPPDSALCGRYDSGSEEAGRVAFQFLPRAVVNAGAAPVTEHVGGTTVDQVTIPLGGGALVAGAATAQGSAGPVHLVTATGTRFPLAGPGELKALGYSETDVVHVAPQLIDLLPAGPVLRAQDALHLSGGVAGP
ncbi:type VII secretion protein EccB [Amycolatopsis sp. BJA-103]|uniref:type VII secretion protein EccB n=1 Tax=Amycolatopsis sp. BJA-103 TaxID=1911175 RepID=UPI000C770ABC|nr:type VII secretion protein EccB [Amycolatopsis sp. BJA-103]AUI60355.1 type VII secretion protein EccB [Amycolatopsis sp. BJA-103]PNE16380.1 type VII secretion protein EccB [Amycolatopsis sp. BJA-103]